MASQGHQTQIPQGSTKGIIIPESFVPSSQYPGKSFDIPGFPYYQAINLSGNISLLRGVHFRYEPYKDRAKVWLPLRNETIPGTPFKRYDSVSLLIYDPTTQIKLDILPHSVCQSGHPWRGYIRLGWNGTTYFKQKYAIDITRLVDNPEIEVYLSPGTHLKPIGHPNQWKPRYLNQAYQLGLLEETAYSLHYDGIVSSNIHFHGGGCRSRPDVIIIMKKKENGETREFLVIIEGKANHESKAPYNLLEGVIQALHKKICQPDYYETTDAIVSLTGEIHKPSWYDVITRIQNPQKLPYNKRTKQCAKEIWNKVQTREHYWQWWYNEHLYVHGIQDLHLLANNRPKDDREEILARLKLIRWG